MFVRYRQVMIDCAEGKYTCGDTHTLVVCLKVIAQVHLYPTDEQKISLLQTLEAVNGVCNRISDSHPFRLPPLTTSDIR